MVTLLLLEIQNRLNWLVKPFTLIKILETKNNRASSFRVFKYCFKRKPLIIIFSDKILSFLRKNSERLFSHKIKNNIDNDFSGLYLNGLMSVEL